MAHQNILKNKSGRKYKAIKHSKQIEVKDRERFGRVIARTKWARSVGRAEWDYYCICDCGKKLRLTYRELAQRRKDNLGCCSLGCPCSPITSAVWSDPKAALLYQWRQAKATHPNILCNEWGGYAYEGVPPAADGYKRFMEVVWPMIDVEKRGWWIHRVSKNLPVYDLNITLKEYPDTGILNPKFINVDLQGSSYALNELAKTYNISESRILKMWSEITDDEEFIASIIDESIKGAASVK